MTNADERRRLRKRLREERRGLDIHVRQRSDKAICRSIQKLGAYRRGRHIGIYFAFDGEPDLAPILRLGSEQGKQFYAPVIDRENMYFSPINGKREMGRNQFGIIEPRSGTTVDPRYLDLILTPLVAFDDHGVRIGVGKGYFDRCFEFLAARDGWRRPKLLGVAYSSQRLPRISAERWDVPLWGIVTEQYRRVFTGD